LHKAREARLRKQWQEYGHRKFADEMSNEYGDHRDQFKYHKYSLLAEKWYWHGTPTRWVKSKWIAEQRARHKFQAQKLGVERMDEFQYFKHTKVTSIYDWC